MNHHLVHILELRQLRSSTAPAMSRYAPGRARVPGAPSRSVDVFLEAIKGSNPGDVLVVDNGGLKDEACVGNLLLVPGFVSMNDAGRQTQTDVIDGT
jgi:hypothetical protein